MEFHGVTLLPAVHPPVENVPLDARASIMTAFDSRPDYRQARHEIEQRGIQLAFNRNQLWPQVDLEASYGLNGRGGSFDQFADDVGSGDNPQWTVGVVVRIPLGNRQARADYQTALLEEERALLELKRLEQQIIVEVDNAAGAVVTNRKRVDATAAAVRLAEESLRAEIERLKNGLSTSLLVLQAQSALADARAAAIRARADYNKSIVELQRAAGTTLQKHGIEITK
jgi:outer membrane protein TolC